MRVSISYTLTDVMLVVTCVISYSVSVVDKIGFAAKVRSSSVLGSYKSLLSDIPPIVLSF